PLLCLPEFSLHEAAAQVCELPDAVGGDGLNLLRRVFLGDLVVEEAGRIRRGHEAAVDLGIDADVLEYLAVRHLDFERAALLVVADRADLGGVNALSVHRDSPPSGARLRGCSQAP